MHRGSDLAAVSLPTGGYLYVDSPAMVRPMRRDRTSRDSEGRPLIDSRSEVEEEGGDEVAGYGPIGGLVSFAPSEISVAAPYGVIGSRSSQWEEDDYNDGVIPAESDAPFAPADASISAPSSAALSSPSYGAVLAATSPSASSAMSSVAVSSSSSSSSAAPSSSYVPPTFGDSSRSSSLVRAPPDRLSSASVSSSQEEQPQQFLRSSLSSASSSTAAAASDGSGLQLIAITDYQAVGKSALFESAAAGIWGPSAVSLSSAAKSSTINWDSAASVPSATDSSGFSSSSSAAAATTLSSNAAVVRSEESSSSLRSLSLDEEEEGSVHQAADEERSVTAVAAESGSPMKVSRVAESEDAERSHSAAMPLRMSAARWVTTAEVSAASRPLSVQLGASLSPLP